MLCLSLTLVVPLAAGMAVTMTPLTSLIMAAVPPSRAGMGSEPVSSTPPRAPPSSRVASYLREPLDGDTMMLFTWNVTSDPREALDLQRLNWSVDRIAEFVTRVVLATPTNR